MSGSIQERNLFGRGYSLGLQGFVSGKSSYLDLSFVNPRIYDTDFGFSNNSYAIWEEWDDFKKKTIGNTIRLFHPIGEYTSVSVATVSTATPCSTFPTRPPAPTRNTRARTSRAS
mgnify:FL=1